VIIKALFGEVEKEAGNLLYAGYRSRLENGNFFYNLLDTNANKAIMAGSHLG
jgi:hypothetical protein